MSSRIGVCCVAILMVIASVVSLETNSQGIEVNPKRANVARRLLQTEGEDPLVAIDRFIQQAQNKLTQPLTVVPDVSQVSQPAVPRPPGYKPLYYYNPLTGLSDNSDNPQPQDYPAQQVSDLDKQPSQQQFDQPQPQSQLQDSSSDSSSQRPQEKKSILPQGLVFEPAQQPGYRTPPPSNVGGQAVKIKSVAEKLGLSPVAPLIPIGGQSSVAPPAGANIFKGIPGLQDIIGISSPQMTQPTASPPDSYTGATAAYPDSPASKVAQDKGYSQQQQSAVGTGESIVDLVQPYVDTKLPQSKRQSTNTEIRSSSRQFQQQQPQQQPQQRQRMPQPQPRPQQPQPQSFDAIENCQVTDGNKCLQCLPEATLISDRCVIIPPNCRTFDIKVNRCIICEDSYVLSRDYQCV